MLTKVSRKHPTNLSFDTYYREYYLPDKNKRIRATTQKRYYYIYRNRIRPYFGDLIMNEISHLHVREWQNIQISLNFKPKYLRTLHQFLKGIFDYCVQFHDLAENPCDRVDAMGRNRTRRRASIWRLDEYERVYRYMSTTQHRAALAVLFWSGIRKGELYGLQWQDYCPLTKSIRVERSYQRLNGKAVIMPLKTEKSYRTILLPSQGYQPLEKYRDKCTHIHKTDFIFPWSKRKLEDEIHLACQRSGVKRIRIHDLRHSHASLLIYLNVDIAAASTRLGHSSISMTLNTYAHAYDNADRQIANTLERVGNPIQPMHPIQGIPVFMST